MLGSAGNAFGASAVPVFIGRAFNAILQATPDYAVVTAMAWSIVASQVARAVLQFLRNFSSATIGQRLERDMRDELYASLIGKPMSFHDRQSIGEIMARSTNDVRELVYFMEPGVNITIGSSAFIVFVILTAPTIHPLLVVVPLAYLVIYVFLVRVFLRDLSGAANRARAAFGAMNTVLAESIEGIETIKGFATEAREQDRFSAKLNDWKAAAIAQGRIEGRFLPGLLLGITMASGLLLSFYLFANGQLQVGSVVAYNGLLLQLQFPTFASQFAYPALATGYASVKRMIGLVQDDIAPAPTPALSATKPAHAIASTNGTAPETQVISQNASGIGGSTLIMNGAVEFRNVSFAYGGGADAKLALENVSFTVLPGQSVAIVGQTGAGKSSIIKLLNRTYDPTAGTILLDGRDVQTWDVASLRKQISIIEQDIFLFSRDVAANIAYGVPGATQDQIEAAARAAQAHTFISGFKDGYATVVGERGVTLSGGQRQRIAIARAFLTDPRILVLDDATSAIDSATEDEIQRAMLHAAEGRTTFFITHRLSQIRWADVIVVLRKGRVQAVGTHEQLLESSPAYREIFVT